MFDRTKSTAAVAETGAALSTQDLWAAYVQGIINASGLPGESLILTGTAVPADLATSSKQLKPVPKTPQALAQIFALGNAMANPSGFYTLSGQNFFSDYATYIDNLAPQSSTTPTTAQQAQITAFQGDVTTAQNTYDSDLASAAAAYNQQSPLFPGKWPTFQDFLNGSSWGGTLTNDQNAADGYNTQLSTLMTQVFGQDYEAIAQAKKVVDQVRVDLTAKSTSTAAEMKIATDAGDFIVPVYVPGDLGVFSSWVDATLAAAAKKQAPEVSFTVNESAQQYDFSQSTYFSEVDWSENENNFFYSYAASGSSSQQQTQVAVDTSSESFGVAISFQAVTSVAIALGPWYDSSLMYSYANPAGLVVPASLLIGLMPTVVVSFDAASYQTAQSAYSTSSSFGVGVFTIDGGAAGSGSSGSSGTNLTGTWSSTALTLTIEDTSKQPKILGMTVLEPSSSPA
jgi:hypothetical protein